MQESARNGEKEREGEKRDGFARWRPEEVHVARPVAQGMATASSTAAAAVVAS